MRSLFIDTSSFFVNIAIVENENILFYYNEEIKNDMSSKVLPIIRNGFDKVHFSLKDIDKIFVVNGPGSFTGVRVGVSIVKTIAWGFNIPIVAISSLELLATSNTDFDFCIPMIDARRGNVFGAIYDKNLNIILKQQLINKEELLKNVTNKHLIVSNDFEDVIKPEINILKIINKHINDKPINPHNLNPKYLKLTQAEEKYIND